MFIRKISRKNKDGSIVVYVQLAHNERNSATGHAKAKILYNFGRLDTLDVEQLKRLIKSISRFLLPQNVLENQVAVQNRGKKLKWISIKSRTGRDQYPQTKRKKQSCSEDFLLEETEVMPEGWGAPVDGCDGRCPTCFQLDYCKIWQKTRTKEELEKERKEK